jgi:hypothetical protein
MKIRTLIAAVCTGGALLFAAPAVASAAPVAGPSSHATFLASAPGRQSCTPGAIGTDVYWRQPGSVTVWWKSKATPTDGCAWIAPEAQDSGGHDTYGGKIHYDNGVQSKATVFDQGYLGKGWVVEWTGASCWKQRLYPTQTAWQRRTNSYCSGLP